MKDEIKEILDKLINKAEHYILYDYEVKQLLDYITNLQERCEYLERSNNRREDEIMSLRDECVDGETYKSRNEKAIDEVIRVLQIILEQPSEDKIDDLWIINRLEGIQTLLQGENNTPENLYKYTPEKGFELVGGNE